MCQHVTIQRDVRWVVTPLGPRHSLHSASFIAPDDGGDFTSSINTDLTHRVRVFSPLLSLMPCTCGCLIDDWLKFTAGSHKTTQLRDYVFEK